MTRVLHVHRGRRADALVPPLARLLGAVPDDPLAAEVLAVPTKGVERWLAQRLSHHLGAAPGEAGICANVRFDPPGRLVGDVLRRLRTGADKADGAEDPWDAEVLAWTVLGVLDDVRELPWAAPLDRYLGGGNQGDPRAGRRLTLARHVAALFAGYAAQRPELTAAWAAGVDGDGAGSAVPVDLAWQPPLWRAVREAVGVPDPGQRLAADLERLTLDPNAVDLPGRLGVFGATRLPRTTLHVLGALSSARDVHLWLVHPSPALWATVDEVVRGPGMPARRRERPLVARHPLLASMASDVVELQARLRDLGSPILDVEHPSAAPPSSRLGHLQTALAGDDPAAPELPGTPDASVQVHACHGRARQVEVLRDVLAGLFADDATLQPRDVLVMCPDVETFAPLVTAAFGPVPGTSEHHPARDLRVQVADRSLRVTNPCLGLLSRLLELADSRVGAAEVLDLVASAPVRARFRFDDDDVERIRAWAIEAGARWGEDERRRARFGLDLVRQGTWDAALDRILLGVAMAEEDHRYLGSALPLDDVPTTGVQLAGRLAELLERLAVVLARLTGVVPAGDWFDALDEALTLLAAAPSGQEWQLVQARGVLAGARAGIAERQGSAELPLRLTDVRDLLAERLRGRPTRAGFRTGALTVCSLEPMRAVPHRVVCLLGMDDGAFPRGSVPDGDDVLLRDPCVGERDSRAEDRQLFLDAVAAAGEVLVVLYSGADERTGAPRPPAVPVAELLDALAAEGGGDGGRRDGHREDGALVVHHPLQPTDVRTFIPGALGRRGPFGFDPAAHRAAVAGTGPRQAAPSLLGRPLPAQRGDVVPLDELVACFEHPARWFLRARVQLRVGREVPEVDERLPLEADPLTCWALGDRLLAARLAGEDPRRARQAEWRRGELPPRWLGAAVLERVDAQVEPIASAVRQWAVGEPTTVDVTADLPQGIPVVGTIGGLHGHDAPVLLRAVFSRLAGKHRLRAWIQLLALASALPERPGHPWQAVTVGRAPGRRTLAAVSVLTAPPAAQAQQRLQDLLLLREHATRAPLPLPVTTASAYAAARGGGTPEPAALDEAARTWRDSHEDADTDWDLCFGTGGQLDPLLGTPTGDEAAWARRLGESTRFGVLARRVWEPLLEAERRWTA